MNLFKYPIPHLLLSLVIGILSGTLIGTSYYLFYLLVAISFFLILLSYSTSIKKTDALQPFISFSSGVIYCAFFLLGMVLVFFNNDLNHNNHYSKFKPTYSGTYEVQIVEAPQVKDKGVQFNAEVIALKSNNKYIETSGTINVFIENSSKTSNLKYGDRLLFTSYLKEVKSSNNPGSFDYASYLKSQEIYHTTYVDSSSWKITLAEQGSHLKSYAIKARSKAITFLENNDMLPRELAVASALFLGDKSLLDYRQSEIYSTAGAMHVLAVSGLHVGVILLLMQFILKPLRKTRWVYLILLLLGIWSFALLTGFSSSVIRAATMFSLVGIGQSLYRNQNIYHTIAFSAFVLLLFDPYLLFDIGFQLSYLAVIGIVYLQPKIYNLIYVRSSVVDKVWKLTAVSIAAQIATFPIAAYYFHMFPTYFFITNLLVIPLTVGILYLGIIVLLFSWIDPLAYFFIQLLNGVIWIMNEAVAIIEKLPYARLGEIRFTLIDVLFFFLSLFFLLRGVEFRKKIPLKWSIFFLLIFWGSRLGYDVYRHNKKEWLVLNQRNNSILVYTSGHNAKWFYLKDDPESLSKLKSNLATETGISQHQMNILKHDNYDFEGVNILVYREKMKNSFAEYKTDFILLSNNEYIPFTKIPEVNENIVFLLDGSNSYAYRKSVKRVLKEMGYNVYDTNDEGAYIQSL